MRTLLPFARYLESYPRARGLFDAIAALDPETCLPAETVRATVREATQLTGLEDLGLRVGRTLMHGEATAIDFVASSASTLAQAIEASARNFRVVNDALRLEVDHLGQSVLLRFESVVPWQRVVSDYLLSAVFVNHLRAQVACLDEVEVWLAHAAPDCQDTYVQTFAPARVCFGAPSYGFKLPAQELERPLRRSDPHLHRVLCAHVARAAAELPSTTSTAQRVATLLLELLPCGTSPTAAEVAARLRVSTRTLARRLEAEGTSFYRVLDALRHQRALEHVRRPELSYKEVSARLGFANTAAFHRAFRRWTGQTAGTFRRLHGRAPLPIGVRGARPANEP